MNYIYAAILSAALGFAAAWNYQSHKYGEQIATMQKDAAVATTKAVKAAMDKTQADQQRKDDALKEANLRSQKNEALAKINIAAARNAAGAANRLRNELATARASLPSLSCEAVRIRAERLDNVFEQCVTKYEGSSERYRELATDTSKIASDARTLEQAWPD